jgi:DNA (cytosine-5)-methyltransferase 1
VRVADLFAGSGGTSTGAAMAGAHVVYAANHSPFSVATHALNHPSAVHVCQDLRQADWSELPPYDLLWASPSCQVYSSANAKKKASRHDGDRATAWAVVDCADITEPSSVVIENVREFRRWRLYPEWRSALAKLGYSLTEHILQASHHGVPQRRERLFLIGTKSGRQPYFHRAMSETPFGPCIDWESGEWKLRTEAAPGAQRRMAVAVRNHGPRCLSQHTTGHKGVPLNEPIRTITTQDHWVVVDGDRYRGLTIPEYLRAQSFATTHRFPEGASRGDCIEGIGNAVPPRLACDVIKAVREAA